MTLILTFLANHHIAQVADRRLTRPDGALYDDDTNKAVFYCGRAAVAYTGLAYMEGKPTAEWIGSSMKDHIQIEAAMNNVAVCADKYLQRAALVDKRLAVVATGWATVGGELPMRQFVSVASNYMTDSWDWTATWGSMRVRTRFLDDAYAWHLFVAGQPITPHEMTRLTRLMNRAYERRATIIDAVRLLQQTVQSVASRNTRVGKGMITHLLSRKAVVEQQSLIVTPLATNCHSFLYTSKDGKSNPFQGAVMACNKTLLTNFVGGTLATGEKSIFEG